VTSSWRPGLAIAALIAAISGVLSGAVTGAAPAAHAQGGQVQLLIESVSPAAPTLGSTLTISGRVANSSDAEVVGAQVQLRYSPLPLNSREEVTQVLAGTSPRSGNAVPGTNRPMTQSLAPGQQAQFRMSVPMTDLGLPEAPGVYAVFVELVSGDASLASAGTVFPWFPKTAGFSPTRLAFVWPIAQKPAVAAYDLVVDPALPNEFATDGRLGRLLQTGLSNDVAWMIDAAVLQTATDLADGYDVKTGNGARPGDKTAAAKSFADSLRSVLGNHPTAVTPQYAIDDADALTRGGQTSAVVRSATLPKVILDAEAKSSSASAVFLSPGGASDSATLQTLVDAGTRTLIMSDDAFPPDPPVSYTPSGVTSMDVGGTQVNVLLTDSRLERALNGPFDTAAARSRATQSFLAETAMITLERPTEPRSVVAMPPVTWDPPKEWLNPLMADIARARWLRPATLDDVLKATPVPRARRGYGQAALRELPQTYIQRIAAQEAALDSLSRIVDDRTGFGETLSLSLQRASSAIWRGQRSARNEFLTTISDQIRDERARVRVVSSGTVTLAGDNGFIPLTIANDFDRAVTVGLQLRTENAVRLEYTPPTPVNIEAHAKKGIEVPVRVIGSAPMEVSVILTDKDGAEYDNSATLEIRSTAATQIAGVVVGVGGVTLAVLVAFNLWRRRKNAKADA
jgi:Family of unknown function (DUF6049)